MDDKLQMSINRKRSSEITSGRINPPLEVSVSAGRKPRIFNAKVDKASTPIFHKKYKNPNSASKPKKSVISKKASPTTLTSP